jgi:DNA (cytosine-5)-methyltransferase 1
MLKVLDLFSGIGGFSLGLERTGGFETVAFCEIEPFPRRVLAKHWPEVPCYEDVCALTSDRLRASGIAIDLICGGFPCQDISESNIKGRGLAGARSGLWSEYARLIRELRPSFAVVENVSNLLDRGFGTVLGDLASCGYDAEWRCIPASELGAPHDRDRVWLVAYPASSERRPLRFTRGRVAWRDTLQQRQEAPGRSAHVLEAAWGDDPLMVADAIVGMDDGLSFRLDGYNGCANAILPQIAEMIGNAILASLAEQEATHAATP